MKVWVSSFVHDGEQENIKIFVTYHKPYPVPIMGEILQPIQVGRAIEKVPYKGSGLSDADIRGLSDVDIQWMHEHTIGDDTGDNISSKNRSFDVLTAYYWVWKHYEEIGNPKYIGFFAHRKILMPQTDECCTFDLKTPDYGLTEQGLVSILQKHPAMVNMWVPSVGMRRMSVYEQYSAWHYAEDLQAMIEIIRRDYPEMIDAMINVLYNVGQPYSVWNYWVMKKELAFDYFERLFHVMFELEKERGDKIDQYELGQQRVFGYLAERFFAIWLEYQVRVNGITLFSAVAKLLR